MTEGSSRKNPWLRPGSGSTIDHDGNDFFFSLVDEAQPAHNSPQDLFGFVPAVFDP
jgi:hypothetical protein